MREDRDAYGRAIYDCLLGLNDTEIIEREDGFIEAIPGGPLNYFKPYQEWPEPEKKAIQFARGRVLDVGCGAGRVGLYLQNLGMDVLGIDNSPLAVEVCRQRGFTNVHVLPVSRIDARLGIFDTVVMFGNNFGLCASYSRAKLLLEKFHRMTSSKAKILAVSNNIYQTENPFHLAYHQRNRQRGRMAGQIRMRVRYKIYKTSWFDYLMVSKEELEDILNGTGWRANRYFLADEGAQYAAVIEKESP